MADVKIKESALGSVSSISGSDFVRVLIGGASKRMTFDNFIPDSDPDGFIIVCSGFGVDLAAGTLVAYFDLPFDFTFTEVIGTVVTAGTGSSIIADVNVDGTTIMDTNKVEIEATGDSSLDATTQPTITDATHSKGQRVSIDIDQIGSTIAGTDLEIQLIGNQS
jgi:hypothetical protein